MVVLGSNEEKGSDIAGITGGGRGVAGEAEGATSGMGSAEGTAGAGALVSASVSMGCGSCGCFACESLDALLQLGLLALHYRLSYLSICQE